MPQWSLCITERTNLHYSLVTSGTARGEGWRPVAGRRIQELVARGGVILFYFWLKSLWLHNGLRTGVFFTQIGQFTRDKSCLPAVESGNLLNRCTGQSPRQARYQAALRPDMNCFTHSKALPNVTPNRYHNFCGLTVHEWPHLQHGCVESRRALRRHLAGLTIHLFQSFALHLQLHLRILLEDLRVALTKHLRYPLVGCSSGT
jgi:hypothetical protein